MGKTSLLARGLDNARRAGARIILTDFQGINADCLGSVEKLLFTLAASIADQLDLADDSLEIWSQHLSPGANLERYLRREVFAVGGPIVWGLDEVDRLFSCSFYNEVFGLFRSWHNKRALDPTGQWHQLTLAIAYATEAHLLITDLNQSPFNVGTRLALEDFTLEQVSELNRRFVSPLQSPDEVNAFFDLINGQPYLAHKGLYEMASRELSFASLEAQAHRDDGPFGDHLRRLIATAKQDAELCDALRLVLRGEPCPTPETFYRLRSGGIVSGEVPATAKPRCPLYGTYLGQHLC